MRWMIAFNAGAFAVVVLAVNACSAPQPASNRTVRSIEVPMIKSEDRADLLSMLHAHAARDHLHLDDVSAAWIELGRDQEPDSPARKSIYLGIWGTAADEDLQVSVDDGGHLGRAWITFFQGEAPARATAFRQSLIVDIKRRWPDARDIPVMPSGALPLPKDMNWDGRAYQVRPDLIADYAASVDDRVR